METQRKLALSFFFSILMRSQVVTLVQFERSAYLDFAIFRCAPSALALQAKPVVHVTTTPGL